ncbi:hypothetical protein EDD36DRAFT_420972 [Exophiala viscosa]|uniref:Uncharacterized protein n=1 Tax=Exophiala viscosa TaxID=2486360 RepID=A0AAN6DRW9_9EURO|nr:hypothetical protein EDD36DRAFT_420972 [Exophiala viscosa]
MADTLGPINNVHEGFWADWSKGGTWGLTWTLCPMHGNILTNVLALYFAILGVRLWVIVRYTLHQITSQSELLTPHLHNEQLILRNAHSGLATARLMLGLACTSRRSSGRPSFRSYSIGLFAIIYAFSFMAGDVLSNFAISVGSTNGGSPVLWRSPRCGVWNETYLEIVNNGDFLDEEEFSQTVEYTAKRASDVQRSLEYAQECYLNSSSTNSSTCHTFKTRNLAWQTDLGSCPFSSQLCHQDSETFVLDTGYIDSHDDLGINATPDNRLKYRRKTTCAVLNDTAHIKGWDGSVVNSSSPKPSPDAAYAYYGESLYKNTDFTYSYSNFASFYTNFTSQVTLAYQIDVEQAIGLADPQWTLSDFQPIPGLVQAKGDLILFFLSFDGMYAGQVEDPWFSAHGQQFFDTELTFLQERYARDSAISTLGCVEQHQFCSANDTCTEFLGFDQVQNVDLVMYGLTPQQNATFDRLLRSVTASSLREVLQDLAKTTTPMLASASMYQGISGDVVSLQLPPNQWGMELQYWHSIAMAQLQRTIVQYATGQIAVDPQYILPAMASQDIWFCKSLVVPSTLYQSYSVMAVILVVALGIFVVVVSFSIESVAALLRKCMGRSTTPRRWSQDNILRLHQPPGASQIPMHPVSGSGYPSSNTLRPDSTLELGILTTRYSTHDIASRAPDPEAPAIPSVSTQIGVGNPSRREPPIRPARDSGMTIHLETLDPAMPIVPLHILEGDRESSHMRRTPSPRLPPTARRPDGDHRNHEGPQNWRPWI